MGGYFGGLLAREYQQSPEIDIYFLCRGKNLAKIRSEGLKVADNEHEFVAYPRMASDKVEDFGLLDYVLICTKTYSLDEVARQIAPAIKESTVLIPLQNGVNSRDILLQNFGSNLVTQGCVYLISRLESPGWVVKKGKVGSFFFGLKNTSDVRLRFLQEILAKSGIKSELSEDIDKVIWEKFIFLSSVATATTYFDSNIREILENEEKRGSLKSLIGEVTELALFKGINVGDNQTERVLDILSNLPADATSSMHSDFANQNEQTELESLTGYVVMEGECLNIPVKTFEGMYNQIKGRSSHSMGK